MRGAVVDFDNSRRMPVSEERKGPIVGEGTTSFQGGARTLCCIYLCDKVVVAWWLISAKVLISASFSFCIPERALLHPMEQQDSPRHPRRHGASCLVVAARGVVPEGQRATGPAGATPRARERAQPSAPAVATCPVRRTDYFISRRHRPGERTRKAAWRPALGATSAGSRHETVKNT